MTGPSCGGTFTGRVTSLAAVVGEYSAVSRFAFLSAYTKLKGTSLARALKRTVQFSARFFKNKLLLRKNNSVALKSSFAITSEAVSKKLSRLPPAALREA